MRASLRIIAALSICLLLAGCGKDYPADTNGVKYANRTSPGAKLDVKKVLEPEKMNLIYFYADW